MSEVRLAHYLIRLIIHSKFKKNVAYALLCCQSGPSVKLTNFSDTYFEKWH